MIDELKRTVSVVKKINANFECVLDKSLLDEADQRLTYFQSKWQLLLDNLIKAESSDLSNETVIQEILVDFHLDLSNLIDELDDMHTLIIKLIRAI
jgi:hypothetical protein